MPLGVQVSGIYLALLQALGATASRYHATIHIDAASLQVGGCAI